MANSKIPYVDITDLLNTQRLRFNDLIDSVGDVSTLTTTGTNVASAIVEHDAELGTISSFAMGTTASTVSTAIAELDGRLDSINETELLSPRMTLSDGAATNTIAGKLEVADSANFADNLSVQGNLLVGGNTIMSGTLTVDGAINFKAGSSNSITLGDNANDNVVFNADINSDIIPNTDTAYDLGSSSQEWRNLYIDGVANIDGIRGDSATFTGNLNVDGLTSLDSTAIVGNLLMNTDKFTVDYLGNTAIAGNLSVADSSNFVDNVSIQGNLAIGGNTTMSGTLTVDGEITFKAGASSNINLGDDANDNVVFNADVNSSIIPNTDDANDLGSSSQEWRHLYIDGTANVDNLAADSATIATLLTTADLYVSDSARVEGDFSTGGNISIGGIASFSSDVAVNNNLTVTNNFTVGGVFTIAGEAKVAAQYIELLSLVTGTPALDGGISVNRGSSDSAIVRWNEGNDYWEAGITTDLKQVARQNDSATFTNIQQTGSGALRLPVGTTVQRPTGAEGQVRYNSTNASFEGYGGSSWGSLGGLIDQDRDTKVIAERVPGADSDTLQFYTAGTLRATLNVDRLYTNVALTVQDSAYITGALVGGSTATFAGDLFVGDSATIDGRSMTLGGGIVSGGTIKTTSGIFYTTGAVGKLLSANNLDIISSGGTVDIYGNTGVRLANNNSASEGVTVTYGSNRTTVAATTTGETIRLSTVGGNIDLYNSTGKTTSHGALIVLDSASISGNMTIGGDLIVNGTTTTVNTETVTIADNIVVFNNNEEGVPSQNAGIEIERGTSANKSFLWDEGNDEWTFGTENVKAGSFEAPSVVSDSALEITVGDDFTINAGGDIILDADGNDILIKNGGGGDTVTMTLSDDALFTIATPDDMYLKVTGDTVYMQGTTANEQLSFQLDTALQTITSSDAFAITSGGTLALSSAGTMTLDASLDIVLDADGNDILIKNGAGGDTVTMNLADTAGFTISTPGFFQLTSATNTTLTTAGDVTFRVGSGIIGLFYGAVRRGNFLLDSANTVKLYVGNVTPVLNTTWSGNEVTFEGNVNTGSVTGTTSLDLIATSGDMTLDASGDIILDADGNDILIKNGAGGDTVTMTLADDALFTIATPNDITIAPTGDINFQAGGGQYYFLGTAGQERVLIDNTLHSGTTEAQRLLINNASIYAQSTISTASGNLYLLADSDIYLRPTGDTVYMQGTSATEQLSFQLDALKQTITASDSLELAAPGGNLTLNTLGDILLDADGGQIYLLDNAVQRGYFDIATASTIKVYTGASTLNTTFTGSELRVQGNITAYYSSDINLKENIVSINDAMDKISKIRGVYFDWTDEHIASRGGEDGYFVQKHDVGVIAQEVREVLPEIVKERTDGTLAVEYQKIVALLIEGMKELKAEIETLKAER